MTTTISVLEQVRKLQEDAENGTLLLSRSRDRLSIFYREGIVQSVSSSMDTHRLGTYLVRAGLLADKDVPKVLSEARKHRTLFGETAVNQKLLQSAELAEAVRHQAMDLFIHALENGFVTESFTKQVHSVYAPAGISVGSVLLEMSRLNPAVLDSESTTLFTLKNQENLSGVPWLPRELCVLAELTTPSSVETLIQSTGLDETTLRRILAVFDRLGMIEEVGVGAAPTSTSSEETGVARKTDFPFERLVPLVSNAVFSEELEIVHNPSSFISEQFKTLKVRLRVLSNAPRVITISSPEQQDGKSLISANFALTLSMEPGRRIVIVDCDLRSPTLDTYLGVSPEPGLIQHLSDGHMSPYCFMRRIGNLYFLTSGGVSDSPTEMLSLRKMKELVETLKKDFDNVILDAPPFAPIADAQIISGLSDGVLMVVRRGKTSNHSVENALKVVDRKKVLGVVFNDVEPTLLNGYFGRYDYGYSRYAYSGKRRIPPSKKGYLDK
jgi:capsular exopolysaccharide synthesis family protein